MLDHSRLLTFSGHPQPTSLRRGITERLHHDILSCWLVPGTILSEAQIAERYGVKKAPVRSALISEERCGLVRALPRHGWQIVPIAPHSIADAFMLRRTLEPTLAAADIFFADCEQIEVTLRIAQSLVVTKDSASFQTGWRLEREILTFLVGTFDNTLLSATLSDLWDRTERFLNFAVCGGAKPLHAVPRTNLIRALERGDTQGARHAIAGELDRQYDYLTGVVMSRAGEIGLVEAKCRPSAIRGTDRNTAHKGEEMSSSSSTTSVTRSTRNRRSPADLGGGDT